MNNLFVKKGDTVVLLAGKNKGKTGKVVAVDPDSNRVVVDGWNIIVKHIKPRGANQPGGKEKTPGPINASNVQVICPACGKNTRIASGTGTDGNKIRVCKKCGASLDVKAKAEKKSAKKAKKDEVAAAEEKPVKKTAKATEAKTTEAKTEAKTTAAKKPAAKTNQKEVKE